MYGVYSTKFREAALAILRRVKRTLAEIKCSSQNLDLAHKTVRFHVTLGVSEGVCQNYITMVDAPLILQQGET